jgi:hypothetical protein
LPGSTTVSGSAVPSNSAPTPVGPPVDAPASPPLTFTQISGGSIVVRNAAADAAIAENKRLNAERFEIQREYALAGNSSPAQAAQADPRYQAILAKQQELSAVAVAGSRQVSEQEYQNSPELRSQFPTIGGAYNLPNATNEPVNPLLTVGNTATTATTAANPAPVTQADVSAQTDPQAPRDSATNSANPAPVTQADVSAQTDPQAPRDGAANADTPPPITRTDVSGQTDPQATGGIITDPVTPRLTTEAGNVQDPAITSGFVPVGPPIIEPQPQPNEYAENIDAAGGAAFNTPKALTTTAAENAAQAKATVAAAQNQQARRVITNQNSQLDWRVRLSLAPGANYLYQDPSLTSGSNGILAPLRKTGGVIFPYTPRIETSYKAEYDTYALTHSNFRGYFYKSSYSDQITLSCPFTAQDTQEANYLLAVIHFFRSVTKMFYGQDPERGAPPPLVFLTGLGQFQFNKHPCLVANFNYSLPADVDYIRARTENFNGVNLGTRRVKQDLPVSTVGSAIKRLQTVFSGQRVPLGAQPSAPTIPNLSTNNATYVPTKLEIAITLLPVQTREQASKQFSLKKFATGDLLKGGFW